MTKPGLIQHYLNAMRVPPSVEPAEFGMWTIVRTDFRKLSVRAAAINRAVVGADTQTALFHMTDATLHQPPGEVVMEDGIVELRKHLPIVLAARGRVLVTGLGLGCVVRGLLANMAVHHIDVVEIDGHIIKHIGPEFDGNPRVKIHHADALEVDWAPDTRFDYAWHDIWCPGNDGLQFLHVKLIARTREFGNPKQGAWAMPRIAGRAMGGLIGMARGR